MIARGALRERGLMVRERGRYVAPLSLFCGCAVRLTHGMLMHVNGGIAVPIEWMR